MFTFVVHPERLAIVRLAQDAAVPEWVRGGFVSVTRTPSEVSIVCAERGVPAGVLHERGKLALAIEGTVPMTSVGIIASLARALADAHVPIFVLATYDTDWILVGHDRFDATREALTALGHSVRGEAPAT
ncbi:MAG TPA: ACT domain-containing protein [Planctomycetota bacterium]|nr:ACT domain-containing protein [Planctomycetota bacterium]